MTSDADTPAAGVGATDLAADEAAVRAVVAGFDEALSRHDYAGAAGFCVEDLVFFGSGDGEEVHDAVNLAPTLTALTAQVAAGGSTWHLDMPDGHQVTVHGDVALVVGCGHSVLVTAAGAQEAARYRLTGLLRRTPAGWRWWLFHGSEAQPWPS